MCRAFVWSAMLVGWLCALLSCSRSPGRPPDILLITIDSLRADQLGAYGGRGGNTPHIDRLAGEGTVYENAVAPMPMTAPSHASMFTSLYPRVHGVLNNRTVLPASALTLAEILSEHGYRTAAFVAVSILGEESGLLQGFQFSVGPTGRSRALSAASVVESVEGWLASERPGAPLFLWVHLFDPHLPYAPPEPYRSRYVSRPAIGNIDWPTLERIARRSHGNMPRQILDHARELYRGEVAYTDNWVGVLRAAADAWRGDRRLITLLTADHGECFEKGVFFEHVDCLWQEGLQVPLIVHDSARPRRSRVKGQASLIDVAPTLLARAGLPIPPGLTGIALGDSEPGPRAVLVEQPRSGTAEGRTERPRVIASVAGMPTAPIRLGEELAGVQEGRWKYLRPAGGPGQLYELSPVSSEPQAVGERYPEEARRLDARLTALLEANPLDATAPERQNADYLKMLRSLGYVH
jgi:arylsulfatase A-like enzyme